MSSSLLLAEEQIAPAFRRQPLADSGHAIDEWNSWGQRREQTMP